MLKVASKLAADCSVIGPSWPSVPALLTATSRRPKRSTPARPGCARRLRSAHPRAGTWRARPGCAVRRPTHGRLRRGGRTPPRSHPGGRRHVRWRGMLVSAPVIRTTGLAGSRWLYPGPSRRHVCRTICCSTAPSSIPNSPRRTPGPSPRGRGRLRRWAQGTVCAQGNLQTNSSEVIRASVLSGMGIGYSPTWLFEDEMAAGELQVLLPDWPAPPLPIHIVSPPQRRQSAKVLAFAQHVAAG